MSSTSDVHSSAIDHDKQPDTTSTSSDSAATDNEYPEQLHTGKVGYGPNYHIGPTFEDKVTGFTEEVKGKILRRPEVVERGHDRITGVLQAKEKEEDEKENPFANEDEKEE